jgi:hypothetical protein
MTVVVVVVRTALRRKPLGSMIPLEITLRTTLRIALAIVLAIVLAMVLTRLEHDIPIQGERSILLPFQATVLLPLRLHRIIAKVTPGRLLEVVIVTGAS